ncbi:protein SSUH2 homolog [Saccostrea echinata]|uniref:protein SSUH2 homolog n=1 Tax=Saccostrea echinata TaxID=191078 RepID=UPI002A7EA67B|nr:protein SSUH2 homolog [Saccostrea echinata]
MEGKEVALTSPLYSPHPQTVDPELMNFKVIDDLDEAACRQALLEHAAESCCYNPNAAKEMDIIHQNKTFTETRKTECKSKPYPGGRVDGPENSSLPSPWDVFCDADKMFHNHIKKIKVPHTESVQPCNGCMAFGDIPCSECHGSGQKNCTCSMWRHNRESDRLLGTNINHTCPWCEDGFLKCDKCSGHGRESCTECKGCRKVKTYIELTVKFTNHLSDYVFQQSALPDDLVKNVSGMLMFEEDLDQVYPLTAYPIPEINNNSIRIVNEHKNAFPTERIFRQRQRLLAIPVTEVHFTWKDTRSCYWIYGMEQKVYAPDFPKQCYCGCVIL